VFKYILLLLGALISSVLANSAFVEKDLLALSKITVQSDPDWINQLNKIGALDESKRHSPLLSHANLPLFQRYQQLYETLPYVSLATLPTPIQKLQTLGSVIGHANIYLKRDDLSGKLYGGNKIRKLEFLLAEAITYGADTVMTFGCAGSNHAVATAIDADMLGLHCIAMLKSQANSYGVRDNLLLHKVYNTEFHYYNTVDMRKIGTLCTWLDHYYYHGKFPYIIPTGGSCPLGAIGFVNAAFELKEQIEQGHLPEPDYIYVPCGSKGTAVGLLLGCTASGLTSKVVAVVVEPADKSLFEQELKQFFHATNKLLHELDPSFDFYEFPSQNLIINHEFRGPNYAVFSEEGAEARELMSHAEEIALDGTYMAKAFACMVDDSKQSDFKDKVILLWNTYCGLDFKEQLEAVDYHQLPHSLHSYFELPVQALDQVIAPTVGTIKETV
jgi:1-aminocyclopropane-1-carboxylate deaminase/D-cysteine desulfhydrase-like pyridoxal-dependent ACC family enzyme